MNVCVSAREGWGRYVVGWSGADRTKTTPQHPPYAQHHHHSAKLQARRVRALTRRLACYLVALLLLVAGFSTFLAVPAAQYVIEFVVVFCLCSVVVCVVIPTLPYRSMDMSLSRIYDICTHLLFIHNQYTRACTCTAASSSSSS